MEMDRSIDSARKNKNGSALRSDNSSPLEPKQNGNTRQGPSFKNVNDIGLKDPDRFSRSSAESEDEDEK